MTKKLLMILGAVAMLAAMAPAQAASYTLEYFPPNGGYNFCDKEPLPTTREPAVPGQNLGAVCVPVSAGKTVRVTSIRDDVNGQFVGGSYMFMTADWVPVGDVNMYTDPVGWADDSCNTCGDFCGTSSSALSAPAGARWFYVHLDSFLDGAPVFGSCDAGTQSTHGTITITVV